MQRTCTTPGCGKPHRASGLCSTCYNRRNYAADERHAKVTVACTQCGAACAKEKSREKRYGGLFCSLACRDLWVKSESRMARAAEKLRKAAAGTTGSRWVAGICGRCSSPFVGLITGEPGRHCSTRCRNRDRASKRRARLKSAVHVPYSRFAIFERDGYRCHLCKRLTIKHQVVPHPRAPVIDHLIPLGEGDDAAYNVATACFMCNSLRRDVGQAQLILFG